MASLQEFVLLLTISVITAAVYGNTSCVSTPKCSCDFSDEKDVGTTKSEMLAGAVGAMGPLLAAGAGFGIYKFIQSRTGSSKFGFERAPSDVTDDSYQEGKQKKASRGRRNSTTPLRTDTNDPNLSRRGSNATILSVTDYDDWDVDSDRGISPRDLDDPRSYMGSPLSSSDVSARITPSYQPTLPSTMKKDNLNSWLG
ncbi:uncharacterized protein LOC117324531 [Pecten maximus]|uniref:uncharacterized protein LOC117324531 n=1 Tax=Pecten maximus TaxID=6579 RepID=UPI0014591B3F|nr:uncharacterized protein LOC117324531 [Pecten maximus]